jgi:hypothetical protein
VSRGILTAGGRETERSREDTMPTPPAEHRPTDREARRAAKVAEFQRRQRSARRSRVIGWTLGVIGALAVAALVTTAVITGTTRPAPDDLAIEGLESFDLPRNHVSGTVDYAGAYGTTPPAGGDHNAVWLNCGVYSEPQPDENAVHALEHGAVWITYDPQTVTGDDLSRLREAAPDTYAVVSPYPGIPAPVVISAWNAQVRLKGVDDPRLQRFIERFWKSKDAPEPGASCTGAVDGPGRIF